MLTTKKEQLQNYVTDHRLWQGIPSVEVTKNGRIFVCLYSGGVGERIGNFSFIIKSDDGGKTFTEPIVAAYKDEHRCFDPCLWIDPLDRLWFFWNTMPNDSAYAAICDNPDADELIWGDPFKIGEDLLLNKPTVLSTGEWLFPVAVWLREMRKIYGIPYDKTKIPGAYVYRSIDNGKTFERLGGADVPNRDFDEHMIVELKDDRLVAYVRKCGGIGVSYSYDGGKTWTKGIDIGMGETSSRIHIRRLKSGRLMLIAHHDSSKNLSERSNLTIFLSEDEGETWPYRFMLDERNDVSYPDSKEADDGYIYIVYDRERGGSSLETTYARAREILMAKLTEEDILAGEVVDKGSFLKKVVSKLGKYYDEASNPYKELKRYSEEELAEMLLEKYPDEISDKIFEFYPVNCMDISAADNEKLDRMIEKLEHITDEKKDVILDMIAIVRTAAAQPKELPSFVNEIKEIIMQNPEEDITVSEIARRLGVSMYYMMHQFKEATGMTVTNYKHALKLLQAKKLLVSSDLSVTEIAYKCGFVNSSYFTKVFSRAEKVTPSQYRKNLSC